MNSGKWVAVRFASLIQEGRKDSLERKGKPNPNLALARGGKKKVVLGRV